MGETKKEDAGNFKLDFKESEKHFPKENYLLKPQEKYDKMYMANYSNEFSSVKTKDGKTHVTYGCEDENIVGGIQLRLKEMGYKGKSGAEINITGTFDENTEEGIRKFQKERGLPITGVLDDATKEEMGFAEDYSISRKGKNATPFNHPFSPPFNLEQYNKEQEKRKAEKEQRIKDREEFESLSFRERLLRSIIEVKPPVLSGVAQGVDMSLRGELEEAEEGDLVTNHDQDSGREYYYNSLGDKYKR